MSGKTNISVDLHKWAMDEMHFRPIGRHINKTALPTSQDFAEICKGQTRDIWQFVVNNIYSAQTVRKVQGNLLLKRRQALPGSDTYRVQYGSQDHYSDGRARLLDRHRALVAELVASQAAVGQLEKDVGQSKDELARTEQSYQSRVSTLRDVQRKAAILDTHSGHVAEEVEQLQEYTQRLNARVHRLNEVASESHKEGAVYSRQGAGSTLESECTKDVRECSKAIGDFLHKLLQRTFGTDKDLVAQNKESLWQQVETLLGRYSAAQLLMSLGIHTQEAAFSLRERTANIDIKQDAARLKFKYEGGGELADLSAPPSLLQSIHQLLEESQKLQISRFMDTERCRNATWRLAPRLEQARELLDDGLRETYRGHDPGAAQLARTLLDTEIDIASHRTAVRVLSSAASSLKDKISVALRDKEALYAKYHNIQDFKKMADNKQNLIRVLVKQNLNASSRLDKQRVEIGTFIARAFSGQDITTRDLTTRLKDCVTTEVEGFATVALNNLMFTMLDSAYKIAVIDLSINRLSTNQHTAGGMVIQKMLQTLKFPSYKAPEELLSHIVTLQKEAANLEATLQLQGHGPGRSESEERALVTNLDALCAEVISHDRAQTDRILPVVHKRLAMVTQALTDCLHTKDSVQAWWDQPAQSVTPWVTVDDWTLQQWRDKWTVTVTRLRQLQMGHNVALQ